MSVVDCKSLVRSLEKAPREPCNRELKRYLESICSSPCPITMEAAISYRVELAKMQRVGRCMSILNQQSPETGAYESEDGVANLPRVQRRYLLKSMESGLRRSQHNRSYFMEAVKREVTPARGKLDPYFYDLLFQWYHEKAEEGAEAVLAEWNDPVVQALDGPKVESSNVSIRRSNVSIEESSKRDLMHKRESMRSPPVFSDDESGSDKAPSGDEMGSEDDM